MQGGEERGLLGGDVVPGSVRNHGKSSTPSQQVTDFWLTTENHIKLSTHMPKVMNFYRVALFYSNRLILDKHWKEETI